MTTHVTAVYENGVLRPTKPLPLKDGDRVELTVEVPAEAGTPDEAVRRILSAKTFDEWIAAADAAAALEPAGSDDLLVALNETRRRAGERLLFLPEHKGIDW